MASKLSDAQLKKIYGLRNDGKPMGIVFDAFEFGYRCPKGHKGEGVITWSEFHRHLWCYRCKLDYLTDICTIKRPDWMTKKAFQEFVDELPFRARIIKGKERIYSDE